MGNQTIGRSLGRVLIALVVVGLSALVVSPVGEALDPPPSVVVRGSVEQVDVTGLTAGASVELLDASSEPVQTLQAGSLGGVVFRKVAPGTGYRVRLVSDGSVSAPVDVHDATPAPWDPSIYNQPIAAGGYQYLTTRDGTKLALTVHLPSGNGPFPTLIEYAGYGYADPSGPQSGLAIIANLMGFAVVDVNMRGTGCSGGAFDYFETLQQLDAYDVIETVAKQSWVSHHKVGMFGISYGGISQLFAAQYNPPSLAAIAPLSVIDSTPTTLYPGGILNTGFAVGWAQGRAHDAEPAGPSTGQGWAWNRIQNGDTTCAANQALHPQAVDLIGKVRANSYYDPAVVDPLDPVNFVHNIHVPVFLVCQWQDEQTGGHCPELVRNMTGTTHKWFTFTNGAHIDALDPATITKLYDFLSLFVAQQAPSPAMGAGRALAPTVYQTALGVPSSDSITLPDDPIQHAGSYDAALSAFERLPTVTIAFDNGAGSAPNGTTVPGNPYAGYQLGFDSLPVPGTQAETWYLGEGGHLGAVPTGGGGIDRYQSDASALGLTNYSGGTGGGGLWGIASQWKWNWQDNPSGSAVSYVTDALAQNTTVIGSGAVHLWVRSSTPDVDLQVTVSEVRPDGTETFVQNGWMRASERKLSTSTANIFGRASTFLEPVPSFTQPDASPMPASDFVPVAVPLYYQGHAYRAGSRIRVTISAPNGSQPVWSFAETQPADGTSQVEIARTPSMPSSLVLPVVPGLDIPTDYPSCPSLRNEPCRTYVAFANQSVELPAPPTTSTTSTTSVPTTTRPAGVAPSPSTTVAAKATSAGAGSGELPMTGTRSWLLVWGAVVMLGAGSLVIWMSRRRRFRS